MNSKESTLQSLAARWRDVPRANQVCDVAQTLLKNSQSAGHSTIEFNSMLVTVTGELHRACGKHETDETTVLGSAIEWLGDDLESLHLAFLDGDTTAAQAVIVALRDALLARLQSDYRLYLLTTRCPDWKTRNALAQAWAEKQPGLGAHQSWEFTDCIDEILDSVDAGELLLKQLRSRSRTETQPFGS